MMKYVVLINPPQPELKQPAAYIPLGLAYLAAMLEEKSVAVKVVNLAKDEKQFLPEADWYGITCQSASFLQVKKLVAKLRRVSKAKIAIGGVHATVAPDQVRQEIKPDVVIRGEAEKIFPKIVLGKRRIKKIVDAGIISDLNSIPWPARHLFNRNDVVDFSGIHGQPKGIPATTILSSRGCPYDCSFCCRRHKMFRTYRVRSAKDVQKELIHLIRVYGIEHVRFVDDEFSLNRKRTIKLCREIANLKLSWVCITRADSLDSDLLKKMKKAGCAEVHIGVEYGSDRMLQLMNKRTSVAILLNGIQSIKDAGLRVKTYLMYGFPGEIDLDRKYTISFLKLAKPDKFTLSRFVPLPGSEFASLKPEDGWFYPDEQDSKYLEYKKQIMEVIKKQVHSNWFNSRIIH